MPDPAPIDPAANPSPVDADLAADAAGEPRPEGRPPPPPGTVVETFWQRTATKAAIAITAALLLSFSDAWITGAPVDRAEVAASVRAIVCAWLTAAGLHTVSPGIRKR